MVSLANDTCADALGDDRVTDSGDLNETDAKKTNGEVSSVVDAYVNKITSPVSSYEELHDKSVSLLSVSNDQSEEVTNSEVTSKNTYLDQVIQSASVDKELIIKPQLKSILIHGISDTKARQAVTRNNGEISSPREKYSNKGVSLASGEKESTPKIHRKSVILRSVSDDKVAHSVSLVTNKDEDIQSDITSMSNEEHTFETTRECNSLHSVFNNQVLNAVRLIPVDSSVLQETCNGIITDHHPSSTISNSSDTQLDVGAKSDESNCVTGTSKVAKSINNVVFLSNMNSTSLKSESLKGNKMFFINGNALDGTSVECKPDDKYNVICLPQVENINDLIKQMEKERPVKSVKAVTTTSFVQLSQANLKNMNRNITLNVTPNSKAATIEPGKQFELLCNKLNDNSANGATNTKQLVTEKVTTTSALDCVPRTTHTSVTTDVTNNEMTSAPGRGILTSVANREMANLSILGKDQDTIEESSAVFQARNDFIKCRRLLIEAAIHPKMPVKQPLPGYTGPTYSCEECDDTFVSVESLAKHKDRRSVLFTYACPVCKTALEFYNRCMFLLHVRGHNTSVKACFLNISMIPANKLNFRLLDDTENSSVKFEEQSFLSSRGSVSSQINPPGRKILIRSIDKSANPSNVRILKSMKKKKKKVGMTASSLNTAVTLNTTTADKTKVKVGQPSVPRTNIRVEIIDNRKPSSDNVLEDKSKSVVEKSKRKLELESSASSDSVTKMKKKKGTDQPHRSNTDSGLEKDNSAASKVTVDEKSNTRTTKVTSKSQTPAIEEIILTSSDEDDVTTETDNKTKVVSCRECHEDVTNLTKHYRGENRPRKEYPCEQCKYFNSSPCALSAHVRMHTKAQPYVCPDCGYFFSTLETFLIHVKQVCFYDFKAIRFKCPECSLLKPSVTQFSEHLRRDHVRDVFKCDACMTSSYSYKVVEQHIKKMHSDQIIRILEGYCCILCPNLLISKTLLQQHINKHVYSLQYLRYVYICKMCKKYASGRMSKFAQHYHSCPQLLTESEKTKARKPTVVRKPVEVEVTVEKDPLSIEEWEADKLKAEYVPSTRFCVMCQKENFTDSSLFCNDCVRYVDAEDTNASNESAISQEVGRSKRKFKCKLCKQFMNRDWPTITKHFEQYHHSDFDVSSRMRSAVENNSLNIGINRKRKSSVKGAEAVATKSPKMEFKYKCAKCGLSTNDRSQFHDHIVSHKLQSNTDFQCLECGWCFIVKPSLEKHLIVVHKIRERDLKEYFRENGIAVGDEKEDEKPSLVENQCEVCYIDCRSKQNYDKHIRTHGMAFVAMQSKAKS